MDVSFFLVAAQRFLRDFREGSAHLVISRAAILGQEHEQIAHGVEIHGVDDRAAISTCMHELGVGEHQQLCRERIGGHPECAGNRAGRHAVGAGPDEGAEHRKPSVLREG